MNESDDSKCGVANFEIGCTWTKKRGGWIEIREANSPQRVRQALSR